MMTFLLKLCGFCGVGGAMTLLSIALIALTNEVFHWPPQLSYVFAYISTLLLSYLLNAKLVFRSTSGIRKLVLYCATYLSGMLIGMIALQILIGVFRRTNVTLLNCLVVFITPIWNFVFVNMIFHKRKEDGNV